MVAGKNFGVIFRFRGFPMPLDLLVSSGHNADTDSVTSPIRSQLALERIARVVLGRVVFSRSAGIRPATAKGGNTPTESVTTQPPEPK
jgi:hypothetical protein